MSRAGRFRTLPLLLILLTLMAAGCAAPLPEKGSITASGDQPLVIGLIVPPVEERAAGGTAIVNGAQLAVEQQPLVRGVQVALQPHDGGCDPDRAEQAARDLAALPNLLGVIGPACSAACVTVSGVLHDPHIVMVTPRCTDISVTRQGHEGVFRTGWTDAVEMVGAARYLDQELDISRVFLVHDGTLYGRNVRDAFKFVYGKQHLAGNERALTGTADYGPVVRAIAKSTAGAVYYAGFAEDAARFLVQLRAAGVTLPVFAPDAVMHAETLTTLGGAAVDGLYVTEAVRLAADGREPFVAAYRARFGVDPGPYAAEAYDAARLLLRAAERTARARRGGIAIDRRTLRSTVHESDVTGASGRIRFRPNGDRIDGAVTRIMRLRDGRFVEEFIVDPDR